MWNRIRFKLITLTGTALVLLGLAMGFLIIRGLQQTQQNAVFRSTALLIEQQRAALLAVATREAQIHTGAIARAAAASRYAAALVQSARPLGLTRPVDAHAQLQLHANGAFADPGSQRISDTYLSRAFPVNSALDDVRDTAVLDGIAPALISEDPDLVAVYFMGPSGFSRYYPPIGLADIVGPDYPILQDPTFLAGTPVADPSRETVWRSPYVDGAGHGLLLTAITPVYDNQTFRGVIGVDVSLMRLIDRLAAIKTTPHSYAFLVSGDGHLIAAPPAALPDLAPTGVATSLSLTDTLMIDLTRNPTFQPMLDAVRQGQPGGTQITLTSGAALLAYAPIPATGWALGIAAPIAEITAPTQQLVTDIEHGNAAILTTTLLLLVGFVVLALIGTAIVSGQIVRPIDRLLAGTRAIAAGDLTTRIVVRARDELGSLATSYNAMTESLQQAQQHLAESNSQLEHTVTQRTTELAARTEALQRSLETIKALSIPILPVREDAIVVPLIGALGPERADQLVATVLDAAVRHRARAVVLDVTGTALIDARVGQILLDIATALRLLGAETILVGVRPEVAQTIVALGLSLKICSAATLQDGLALVARTPQHMSHA